jgi:hypothetical protein
MIKWPVKNLSFQSFGLGIIIMTNSFSLEMVGRVAIATGISGLLGLVFITLFFAVGQPFGTLNDIFIGLTAILSIVLAWMFYPSHHAQSPILSQLTIVIAIIGALVVVIGSVLTIAGITGWYLSGLYMAAGNALIGLWLIAINYSSWQGTPFPFGLVIFGLISGVILTLGLVAIPGIFRGIDSKEYTLTLVNAFWWTSALGWLVLYPIWCVLTGRTLLLK